MTFFIFEWIAFLKLQKYSPQNALFENITTVFVSKKQKVVEKVSKTPVSTSSPQNILLNVCTCVCEDIKHVEINNIFPHILIKLVILRFLKSKLVYYRLYYDKIQNRIFTYRGHTASQKHQHKSDE